MMVFLCFFFAFSQVPRGLSATCALSCGSRYSSSPTGWFRCVCLPTCTPSRCAGTWAAKPVTCWEASTAAHPPLTACSGEMVLDVMEDYKSQKWISWLSKKAVLAKLHWTYTESFFSTATLFSASSQLLLISWFLSFTSSLISMPGLASLSSSAWLYTSVSRTC